MKTKMNLARGGASTSKKLLAAIAVLAVAFVVLAALPVTLTDSDAGGESTPVSEEPLKGLYGNTMAWDEGKKTYTLTADTTVNLTADKTIDARFVGDYKLTIKSTGNGDCVS